MTARILNILLAMTKNNRKTIKHRIMSIDLIVKHNNRVLSTAKLLIHASVLMQNTVQIALNPNTKLLKP